MKKVQVLKFHRELLSHRYQSLACKGVSIGRKDHMSYSMTVTIKRSNVFEFQVLTKTKTTTDNKK
ncbi:MAG: hypothetical protein QF371_06320 [Flavobacteriales bacterium]|nr:hypothetical protein [Flavobacteriales bacterium]